MLSFLCSLTFAAALEPGSHVLVKTGAALSRPGGAWSAVPTSPDIAWPATVVADRGDVLDVRLSEDGCATPLGSARLLGVTFSVRKADLQPVVSHAARAGFAPRRPCGHRGGARCQALGGTSSDSSSPLGTKLTPWWTR